MDRQLMLINKERQGSFFSGLVLPEVRPQLQKKDVFLIGAVEDKTPVGAAVLRLHPEAGEILSIASAVQRRREKIGTALLWESVRTLRKLGSSGLYGYLLEEDRAAAALFQAFGMRPEKQSNVSYSCTLSQIQKLLPKSERTHTYPLEAVPSYLFSAYSSQALNGGMQAYSQALFAPKCSRVLLEDQKITACILLEQTPEGLSIGWLHSFSKEKNAVLYLLQDALQAAAGLPPDTHIRFLTNLPRVLRLAEKLLPGGAEWTETRWAIEYEYFRLLDPTTKVWEGQTLHEYQNKEEQKCAAVHQEPVEQEHLKQQLQQAPISEETQQIEQGPLQQLQQMEAAAPMLQIQPAAPAFEELTTGYQQRKRGANQSKRERKQREKKVEAHDIDVCEQKIIKMGEIDRKDREALQKGQFSAQIKDDLTMLQDATHTKREIKSMRKRVPSYGILREDLTGYERRNRSLKFRERLPLRKEYLVQQDVDRLVHNYHVDLYLTEEYRPSPLISKFNDAYQCEPQFSAEDERLQVQKHDLSKKIDSCKDEAEKKKLAQQIEDVNRELKKFQELSLYIKNVAGQHGMQAEVHQVRLKAMENAFKQLELEEQNEPSVYTQAMIENLRARRETLRADIQKEFAEYTNPKLNDSLKPEEVEEKRASFKLMLERVDDMAEAYREKKKHIADGMDPDEAEAAYQAKSLNLIRAYTQAPSAKQSGGDKA